MAYKIPTEIGTKDLQELTDVIRCGHVNLYAEGRLFWKPNWNSRYLVLCKSNVKKSTWNLCCFLDPFAEKAEKNYSLMDFESCKVFDEPKRNVVGFVLRFEEPTVKPLTFRCDTAESRQNWVEKLQDAIKDAHKDSGYSSETDRESKQYATIDDDGCGGNAVDDTDGPKPRYHKFGNIGKGNTELKTKDLSSENQRDPDNTRVKQFMSYPVQETKHKTVGKGCIKNDDKSHMCELENALDNWDKRKKNKGIKSDVLTHSQTSDQENSEHHTVEKVIDNSSGCTSATSDISSPSFLSVAGRSDSFISFGKGSSLDSVVGEISIASRENKNTEHIAINQNKLNSLPEGRSQTKRGRMKEFPSLPGQQKHSRPNPLVFASSSLNGFTNYGEKLSKESCSGNDEKKNKGLKLSKSLIGSCSVSVPIYQEPTYKTRCQGEENIQDILHISETDKNLSQEDDYNIYENTDVCFSKGYSDRCLNDQDNRRASNNSNTSSLHSAQSSSSFSSRDSNTSTLSTMGYESPDESAKYENTNFFRNEEYFCEERKDIKRALKNKSIGTFVVCPVETNSELFVVTEQDIKIFRIHKQEQRLSLFNNFSNPDYIFPTLDTLLFFYHINDLPSKNFKVKLERGYRSVTN